MAWRNCNASLRLADAVNARWPGRSKASDGTIGDAAHASRSNASDHNPFIVVGGVGVVRARDITRAGCDLPWLFEQLRVMGQRGDARLTGGGYLILDRRITTPDFSGWKVYRGVNPHEKHGHVSFSRNQAGFDSNAPWTFGVAAPAPGRPAPAASKFPTIQLGSRGPAVATFQRFRGLKDDGIFGPATQESVKGYQRMKGLTPDGIVGPATWRATGL